VIVARSVEEIALEGPLAASVGVFDGVHRGHRAVFDALRAEAARLGAASLVVTFDPHPLAVLRPAAAPKLLTTPAERIRLIGDAGPDAVLVHRFDRETAGLSAAAFLERVVPPRARLQALVIGHDFRMGKDRSGGFEELRALGGERGFQVVRVGPSLEEREPISSSRIRTAIEEGRVGDAARLLGHDYVVEGTVVQGRGVGRTLEVPTANVDVGDERKLLPGHGVYAAVVRILDRPGEPRPAVVNHGVRPTFGGGDPALEVHLLGFDGDLRGARLAVELVERIREERTFARPEDLVRRIGEDVEEARRILRDRGRVSALAPPGGLC
jgi:riboflavin kinase/FMN adenylyltransferase